MCILKSLRDAKTYTPLAAPPDELRQLLADSHTLDTLRQLVNGPVTAQAHAHMAHTFNDPELHPQTNLTFHDGHRQTYRRLQHLLKQLPDGIHGFKQPEWLMALATHAAGSIRERLALPETAFSYLSSHGSLDIEHMQTYRRLMNQLEDPQDQAAVIHASKVVYRLYTDMFRGLPRDGESLHAPV